jgi:hypothetical protein
LKVHLGVEKHDLPLAITVSPASRHDSKGMIPMLHQLASCGFKETALGDLSYRGERLSKAGEALGITIQPSAGGHGGTFIPQGIRWTLVHKSACGGISPFPAGDQAARWDTDMPRPVMMLMTLQATLASVFCVGRVQA